MAVAVTYRTGEAPSKLRTVIVDAARTQVVLLPAGRLSIVTGKQLHGQQCRHKFWDEALGLDSDDFAVESGQVTQVREIGPVKTRKNCR